MKQYLSILVGVIIIAAVVFFALQYTNTGEEDLTATPTVIPLTQNEFTEVAPSTTPETTVSPTASPAAKSVSVSIEDTGFTPATVTIPVGTTVVFTNNGQALHWPASDPHPVHTDLPGFDAKKGLATGETYSFTFTKAGTFGVHDHLNARMKGSIVVQ